MFILKRKAQSTLEYAILIGVIVAALIGMQRYLKRGYQGKLKESADSMGEQFSPYHTTYRYVTNSFTNSEEILNLGTSTTKILNQETRKAGTENVENLITENWFVR